MGIATSFSTMFLGLQESSPEQNVDPLSRLCRAQARGKLTFFFLPVEPQLVSQATASSLAECSGDKPPFNFGRRQESTTWTSLEYHKPFD